MTDAAVAVMPSTNRTCFTNVFASLIGPSAYASLDHALELLAKRSTQDISRPGTTNTLAITLNPRISM